MIVPRILPTPTTLMNRAWQYDPAGNITHRNTEDGLWQYGYDKLGRLTKVTPPEALTTNNTLPEEQYTYDAVGNRTASLHQPGAWQYNQDNQLLQWGTDSDLTALTWTAAGQTHTQSYGGQTRTHHYDATQRLVQVNDDNANLASYRYDPLGRRISKSVNGQTTWYLYSEEGMIAELDQQGKIIKGYGYTPDTSYGTAPLWQAEAGSTNQLSTATLHYIHTDHLGTPQMATNREGHQTWKGHSEAFGKITPDPASLITMNLRFPGQYLDQETNTHYNWHRDYSPSIGRYIQSDPIKLRGGMNLYLYAGANPGQYFDGRGLSPDERPYPGHQAVCGEAVRKGLHKTKNSNNKSGGGVICLGGEKFACSFEKIYDGDEVAVSNRPGYILAFELHNHCTIVHEIVHFRHVDCEPCNNEMHRPGFRHEVDQPFGECDAHSAGVSCLEAMIPMCGTNKECQIFLQFWIEAYEEIRDGFCRRATELTEAL